LLCLWWWVRGLQFGDLRFGPREGCWRDSRWYRTVVVPSGCGELGCGTVGAFRRLAVNGGGDLRSASYRATHCPFVCLVAAVVVCMGTKEEAVTLAVGIWSIPVARTSFWLSNIAAGYSATGSSFRVGRVALGCLAHAGRGPNRQRSAVKIAALPCRAGRVHQYGRPEPSTIAHSVLACLWGPRTAGWPHPNAESVLNDSQIRLDSIIACSPQHAAQIIAKTALK
jgi:hypothetical protein